MAKRLNDDISVNDGGGLFDSDGLIDTLIVDCNNLPRHLFVGQYVQFCNIIVGMVQKLGRLKDGLKADLAAKDQMIRELREINDELAAVAYGLPVDGVEETDAPA